MFSFTTWMPFSVMFCGFFLLKTEASGANYERPGDWYIDTRDCGTGSIYERQSPIDIRDDESTYVEIPPLEFSYADSDKPFAVTYTGDGGGVTILDKNEFHFSGGGLPTTFVLDQFHFHTPSEHIHNGKNTIMEIHLVHTNGDIEKDVVSHRHGLSVFGVMFEFGEPNVFLEDFLAKIVNRSDWDREHGHHANGTVKHDVQKVAIDFPHMSGLLPADANTRFYSYPGSLTTPPCYESVSWYVAATKQTMSVQQFITLNRLHSTSVTNRPIQNTNDRFVRRSFKLDSSGLNMAVQYTTVCFLLSVFMLFM